MIRIIFIVLFVLLLNFPCQESETARHIFYHFMKNLLAVELDHQDVESVNLNLPVILPGGPWWPGACYHLFHGFRNQLVLGDVQPELTHCGLTQPIIQKRFIGGAETGQLAHPWMVVIKAKNGNRVIRVTSGIIIHRRFILASSHGIPAEAQRLCIIIGGALIGGGRIRESHRAFTRDILKDGAVRYMPGNELNGHEHRGLALIDLRNARIQAYNDFVRPACIPAFLMPVPENQQTCEFMQNEDVTVAGFGHTVYFNDPQKLNKQQMTVLDQAQLSQAVLLTSNQNGRAARGDYGAPIEVNRNLANPQQPQQDDVRKFALALITFVHPPVPNVADPDVIAFDLIQAAPWITHTIQQFIQQNVN